MPLADITNQGAAAHNTSVSSVSRLSGGKRWSKNSDEQRQRIIYRVMNEGLSITALGQEGQLARTTVWGTTRRSEECGHTNRLALGGNKLPPELDADDLALLLEWADKHPDATPANT